MTRWRVARDVAWVDDVLEENLVAVVLLPDGSPLALADSSALIWHTLVEESRPIDEPALLALLAERTGADPDTIGPSLRPFLDHLTAEGVLESA